MKYAEVAEALQISTSTVKKHIIKALKTLRELFIGAGGNARFRSLLVSIYNKVYRFCGAYI